MTPFLGSNRLYGPQSQDVWASPDHTVAGLRIGVGITAPWWSRVFFSESQTPFADAAGLYRETLKVLAGLLAVPLAALNHAELTYEAFGESWSALHHELDLRFGTGF